MKKAILFALCAAMMISLAACGAANPSGETSHSSGSSSADASTDSSTSAVQGGEAGPDGAIETALSAQQIEGAQQAALDYYADTVFSVNSMELVEEDASAPDKDYDCSFSVNVSKGGVVQEPNRTICLKWADNTWTVVDEGF